MTKPVTWTPDARSALDRLSGRLFATTTEAAAVLDYDKRTVRRGIESGEIPHTRVGATYRIPTAWIRAQVQLGSSGGDHAA